MRTYTREEKQQKLAKATGVAGYDTIDDVLEDAATDCVSTRSA